MVMSDETLAVCDCGSQWFRLVARETDPPFMQSGAIAFTELGSVSAWSGKAVCIECWEEYEFGAEHPTASITLIRPNLRGDDGA